MKLRSVVLVAAALLLCGTASGQQKAALDALVGSWKGPVAAGAATLTFVVKFAVDAQGQLQGTLAVPEQGGRPLPMADIQFAGNKLDFKIQAVAGEYAATFANGTLDGLWRQGGMPAEGLPVVLKKGEYIAPSYALKLSAESFGLLAGTWNGSLEVPGPQGQITLPLVLRFETNKQGERVAFLDSPAQQATGVPVTDASFTAGKLFVRVEVAQAEYNATLAGGSLTGEFSQGPNSFPLTLTRK